MVSMGSRWYLVAFDLERDDWRIFRLDRMSDARSVGHRFRARDLPADDLADYVAGKTRQVRHQVSATVRVHASAAFVEERMGRWNEETVEVEDEHTCLVRIGGPSMTDIAFWLGILEPTSRSSTHPSWRTPYASSRSATPAPPEGADSRSICSFRTPVTRACPGF